MIDRLPAPWPLAPVALFPVSAPRTRVEEPSARVEDRIASMVRHGGQDRAASVEAAPLPGARDLEFSGMVSAVSLATLTALLRTGSLQGTNRRYRGAITSRSWPS
jgi:hypothetical protein